MEFAEQIFSRKSLAKAASYLVLTPLVTLAVGFLVGNVLMMLLLGVSLGAAGAAITLLVSKLFAEKRAPKFKGR